MARRWLVLVVFGFWNLLVWGTRIDNIWGDVELTSAGKWWRTTLALSFVLAGLAVLAVAWRTRRPGIDPIAGPIVSVVAAWTTAVWLIRGTAIVFGGHATAFVVVHLVLAAVSIGLAAWSVISVRSWGAGAAREVSERSVVDN